MSIEATAWALGVSGVPDPTARVILIGLANHAAADGSAAWPSVSTLAAYAVCSERTVHRRLRDLEALGLIRKGEQQLVDHLPSNRRPVVYDLPVGVSAWQASRGDRLAGVTPQAVRGDTPGTSGVTLVADKPSIEPSMNHPYPPTPPRGDEQGTLLTPEPPTPRGFTYPDSFEVWWSTWPKPGDSKRPAFTAWERATKGTAKCPARVTVAQLQAAVEQFAADPNLPDPRTEAQFIPAASTWLNQDRWTNGPLPARGRVNGRPRAGDTNAAMRRGLTAAQAYQALEQAQATPQQSIEREAAS